MTYEELKNNNDMRIADWFSLSEKIAYPWQVWNAREEFWIESETEKAVKVGWNATTCDGEFESVRYGWIPKAAIESKSAYHARKEAAFESGKNRYEKIIAFCKEHKVKGARVGLRTATLLQKIKDAGLQFAA